MNKLRKFLVVGVMVLSIIAMSGLVAPTTKAAASAGDLIKMDGLSSVYYLGSDGKRYVFPNESTYFSWYADFSGVVTIPASELQSYPLGGNVTMRPGTKLVKITTDPSVYAVEPNGMLRKIQSEAQAAALYGTNWSKRVVDIADSFFTNYTIGSVLADGAVPVGSLVKNANNAAVYYYDGTNYRMISSEAALAANRFMMGNILTITNTITAGGSAITGAETDLVKTSQNVTGPVVVISGSAMVSLSSMTPAASSVPENVSVDMMKFNITAGNDGDATINGIKFSAAGLGNYADIDQVTVYDNGMKLGNSRDVDSNKVAQINFTNALVIARGTTKTLTVKASVAGTQNYGLSILAASDISATSAIVGSFPINSNIFSGVNVTVGGLTIDTDGSLSNVKLGDKAATLAKFKVTNNGSVEDITLNSITLKKDSVSSASDSDFENMALSVDGVTVSSGAMISNRYVTFNLTSPVTILKNSVKRFTVKGDVVGGASKALTLVLDSKADINATGNYYGYGATITNNLTTGTSVSIDAGAVSIEKVNAANTKIKQFCNACPDCAAGNTHMCSHGSVPGVTVNGAFAEYCVSKYTGLFKLPDNVSYAAGACIEPLACAVNGMNKLDIKPGQFVAVFGPGPIGIWMTELAKKAYGAGKVALIGTRDFRLEAGKKAGADFVFNDREKGSKYYVPDVKKAIQEAGGGRLADRLITPAGPDAALEMAVECGGNCSIIVQFGLPDGDGSFNIPSLSFHTMDKQIRSAWLAPGVWPQTIRLVEEKQVSIEPLITHTAPLKDAAKAIVDLRNRVGNPIKCEIVL